MDKIFNSFNNTLLKKIINVYDDTISGGFGDYLRGSFCFFQICKILNLTFDMDMSKHSLSKFLITNNTNYIKIMDLNDNNFLGMDEHGTPIKNSMNFLKKIIRILNNHNEETLYIYSNAFPIFSNISNINRDFIKSKIQMNSFLQDNMNIRLKNSNITPNNYNVIHIRSGDSFLLNNDKNISRDYINKLVFILSKLSTIH